MRVVGGRWRGHPLEAPTGRNVTRPTTDRMRESIASMVLSAQGLDLSADAVLDAFAGSGAMGLELLSRGAARCTFADSDRGAVALVRRNLKAVGAGPGTWHVTGGDVRRLAVRGLPGAPFSVVFLDPPYAMAAGEVSALVVTLRESGQLGPAALVVYERSSSAPGLTLPGSRLLRSKEHGITTVDLLRLDGDPSDRTAGGPASEDPAKGNAHE